MGTTPGFCRNKNGKCLGTARWIRRKHPFFKHSKHRESQQPSRKNLPNIKSWFLDHTPWLQSLFQLVLICILKQIAFDCENLHAVWRLFIYRNAPSSGTSQTQTFRNPLAYDTLLFAFIYASRLWSFHAIYKNVMYICQSLANVLCTFIPWNETLIVAVPHAPFLEVHLHLAATKRRLFLSFFALLATAKMCLTSESTVKSITVTRQMRIKMITVRFSNTSNARKHGQSRAECITSWPVSASNLCMLCIWKFSLGCRAGFKESWPSNRQIEACKVHRSVTHYDWRALESQPLINTSFWIQLDYVGCIQLASL